MADSKYNNASSSFYLLVDKMNKLKQNKKCPTAGCNGNLINTEDGFATCDKCGRKFIKSN